MKRFSIVVSILLALAVTANAQSKKSKKEAPKDPTEHFVKALELDDAAAAKFADVYKAYREDVKALRPEKNGERKRPDEKTDAEVEAEIQAQFDQSQKLLDLRKSYYGKFREFMTPKQIQKFYMMEKHAGGHGPGQRGPGGPGPQGPRPDNASANFDD